MGISTVRGEFRKVSGSVNYDPADPRKTTIEATIDATTVDTRVDMRDKDLRSPNFLDVEKYPTILSNSEATESAGAGKLKITGDLTIHGVTKEVVLDVDGPDRPGERPRGNSPHGRIRQHENQSQGFRREWAPTMAGDEITITIDTELVKSRTGPAVACCIEPVRNEWRRGVPASSIRCLCVGGD